jgi:hypothetical protein
MIYILCLKNIYEKYYEYIDSILINRNNCNLVILNNIDEIINNINNYFLNNTINIKNNFSNIDQIEGITIKENMISPEFNNIIFLIIHPINDNFIIYLNNNLIKLNNNINIKKSLFILNLNNLNNFNLTNLKNISFDLINNILQYDINLYINYLCDHNFYNYCDGVIEGNDTIYNNYIESIHKEKIYDIALIGKIDCEHKKNIYEKLKNNNININIIEGFGEKTNEILFKHKILLNLTNGKEYNLINHINSNKCLFNNMIVINENDIEDNKNIIFDDFIITINYNFIDIFINFIISNYKSIYSRIFKNFNTKKIKNDFTFNKNLGISIKNIISPEYITKESNYNFGFIILRHVNSEKTNNYWIECYKSIRKYYNNKIIIIDDNSNYDFIKYDNLHIYNCEIVQSEYNTNGEILGYYYFYKNKYFEKAVIIHDSVFIQKYINFNEYDSIKYLWHFTHHWDNDTEELILLEYLKKNLVNELVEFYYNKDKWYGIFGSQSVIDYKFLDKIIKKYDLFNLLNIINNREKRMNFERIFGLLCCYENSNLVNDPSIFGIIHHYIHWGYTYDSYINDKNTDKLKDKKIIKVWTGR